MGECILTAVFLINRLPSSILHNKTPFELLYHKPPSYSFLRSFGCLCFASTIAAHRPKFDPRAREWVFIGYPYNIKGYKLLDLKSRCIFISIDVIFHEFTFPFLSKSSSPSVPSQPSPTTNPFLFEPCSFLGSGHPSSSVMPASALASDVPSASVSVAKPIVELPVAEPAIVLAAMPNAELVVPAPPLRNPIRKSTRTSSKPTYLQAYHCNQVSTIAPPASSSSSSTPYPLSSYFSYANLSSNHRHFCNAISFIVEPKHYDQAVLDPQWREAMASEIKALEANNTWSLQPLPPGKKAIGCKWVYKVKYKVDGTVERFKARLVAKGYTQKEGLDYIENFSPVAKLVYVKCLLAVAAVKRCSLSQLDVNNASCTVTCIRKCF